MNSTTQSLPFAILLFAVLCSHAAAQANHCAHCGCHAECQKFCRLVCEEKKVEVVCWGCKHEEFCVPRHSKPNCMHCETVCDACESCDPASPHTEPKRFVWRDWIPGGAKIYSRTKLMRKTVTVSVPGYKWVTEDLCTACAAATGDGSTRLATPATDVSLPR